MRAQGKLSSRGIDPEQLEDCLSADDFASAFRMERGQFAALPKWRQVRLKKEAGLF